MYKNMVPLILRTRLPPTLLRGQVIKWEMSIQSLKELLPDSYSSFSGAVMFVHFGDGQRKYEAKLQSIRAGKVQPEVLTVTSQSNSQNRAGQRGSPHFVCSASRQARIVLLPALSLSDGTKTGDSITGYYFPDGYLVPGWRNRTRIVNPEMLPPANMTLW